MNDEICTVTALTEEISVIERSDVVKLALDIGENMLMCGGEVDRVEDTISRICNAYGAIRTDVFSITSVTIVTAVWADGDIVTQSRRVPGVSRNFDRLGALNEISRQLCRKQISFKDAKKAIHDIINTKKKSAIMAFVGSLIASGGFVLFFGGTFRDCLAAMIAAILIFTIDKYIYSTRINAVVYYMLASFLAGIVSIGTVYVGIGQHLDMIMIGCIMLVIPGINFTSAVEDILVGDTATGTLKFCESILLACSIAGGFAFSVYLCKASGLLINGVPFKESALQIAWALTGSLGFSLLYSLRGKRLLWASLGGAVAWAVYIFVSYYSNGNLFLCGTVSAMVATAYSEVFARILKTPKTAFIFPAIVPMVPGGGLYYTMSNLITKDYTKAIEYALNTFTTAIALAFGIVVVILWVKTVKYIKAKKAK